ncbi:MAG TPA: hypothetical protein PLC53_00560 [Bacilli bacterium]|nr:hypothetical protein [Bacilli bacterium]
MNRNKKNDITIVILSAIILLLIGLFVYLNFFHNNIANENTIEDNYIEVGNFDELSNTFEEILTDKELYNIAKYEESISDFNSLENEDKIEIAYNSIVDEVEDPYEEGISIDLFNNYFENTYYEDINWDKDDIYCPICGEVLFYYDSVTDSYIYNEDHLGHGGYVVENYFSKIINIENDGDLYKVTEVKLWLYFYDVGPSTLTEGYDTYFNAKNEVYPLFILENDDYLEDNLYYYLLEEITNNFDKYKNNMATYIYTFKKANDEYLLVTFDFEDR